MRGKLLPTDEVRTYQIHIALLLALMLVWGTVAGAQDEETAEPRRMEQRIDDRVRETDGNQPEGETGEADEAGAETAPEADQGDEPGFGRVDDAWEPETGPTVPQAERREMRVDEEGVQPERFDVRVPGAEIDEGPIGQSYRYLGRLPTGTRFQGTKGAGERMPLAGLQFPPAVSDIAHTYFNKLVKVSASLTLGVRYTDNIYLEPDDEADEDVVFRVSPAVNVEIGGKKAYVEFRYRPVIVLPTLESYDQNARVDHEFVIASAYRAHRTLKFLFVNIFGVRSITADSERDEVDRFFDNSSMFSVIYQPLEAWALELTYDHYFTVFQDEVDQADDLYQDTFRANVYRRLWQKVWMFVYGSFSYVNNRNDRLVPSTDNRNYSGGVGVRWAPRANFSGRVDVGYSRKDFLNDAWDDESTVTVTGVASYKPHRRWTISLTAFRSMYETSQANDTFSSGAVLTRTSFSATGQYRIRRDWTASLQFFGGWDDYASSGAGTADRDAVLYGTVLGVFYQPRDWVSLSLVYEHQRNDSNFDPDDFVENSVTLASRFTF